MIASGDIKEDPRQRMMIDELNKLWETLQQPLPDNVPVSPLEPSKPESSSFMKKLFSSSKSEPVTETTEAPEAPVRRIPPLHGSLAPSQLPTLYYPHQRTFSPPLTVSLLQSPRKCLSAASTCGAASAVARR
jgi:hypothetical protein